MLIDLTVVIHVLATSILLGVAAPRPSQTEINEVQALSMMRDLAAKQSKFLAARLMDEDQDGNGEYAALGEISGFAYLFRNGIGVTAPLSPPLFPAPFPSIDSWGHGVAWGYAFVVFLPSNGAYGCPDHAGGGASPSVDPDVCEQLWSAYAWPIVAGLTGKRAFFVNQGCQVLQTWMTATQYSGSAWPNAPFPYAALSGITMTSAPVLAPLPALDGNVWTPAP